MKLDFTDTMAIVVACLGATILGAFVVATMPDYREARVVSRQPLTHEAIDGLFIGAAVRDTMVYEVVAAGVVVHVLPVVALCLRPRGLLIGATFGVIFFSMVAMFLALRTQAPILAFGAATSTTLGPLCVLTVTRRNQVRSVA